MENYETRLNHIRCFQCQIFSFFLFLGGVSGIRNSLFCIIKKMLLSFYISRYRAWRRQKKKEKFHKTFNGVVDVGKEGNTDLQKNNRLQSHRAFSLSMSFFFRKKKLNMCTHAKNSKYKTIIHFVRIFKRELEDK